MINEKILKITTGIQKLLTDKINIPLKILNDKDRQIFIKILETFEFENYKPIRGESKSSRYKQSEKIPKNHNLEGRRVKIINSSNIIDIYTRLEIY